LTTFVGLLSISLDDFDRVIQQRWNSRQRKNSRQGVFGVQSLLPLHSRSDFWGQVSRHGCFE
jgi:hypothetical protein